MEENLSVKKDQTLPNNNLNQAMNAALNLSSSVGNFYLNLFQSSLKVAYQFNRELLRELADLNQSTSENLQSIADTNNKAFLNAVGSTRNALNQQRRSILEDEVSLQLDYQLLAKLVAEEMKKDSNK